VVVGYDRWFARAGDYTYRRCGGCGLIALDPLPATDEIAGFYPPAYYAHLEGPPRNLDKPINRLALRYYYGTGSAGRSRLLRWIFAALSGRILAGVLPPWGDNRLLDVGCGTGALLDLYRRLGWEVAGIDRSPDAVAAARGRGLPVHLGDVFDASFGARFDIVLLSHVIEHVRDPVAVLARAATFLAPGGRIVIRTPNARSLGFAWYRSCWFALEAPRHLYLFAPSTLPRLAQLAGLVPVRIATRGDPTTLSYSRHYVLTQGHVLPAGLPAREDLLRDAPARLVVDRRHRNCVTPLSWVAARLGRGEALDAELRLPSSGTPG
jgi:SAM-dependent methyltransferase